MLSGAICAQAEERLPADQGLELFERKVRPILAERCHACHSARVATPEAGLFLDSREGFLKGGTSGPAVVPGDPDKSLLIRAVRSDDKKLQMPPPEKERLTAQEVADLEAWVRLGAPFPRGAVTNEVPDLNEARRRSEERRVG